MVHKKEIHLVRRVRNIKSADMICEVDACFAMRTVPCCHRGVSSAFVGAIRAARPNRSDDVRCIFR